MTKSTFKGHSSRTYASMPDAHKKETKWFLWGAAGYFAMHILLRMIYPSSALELDEAEQMYFTQWFDVGYGAKGPLYTWLQIVFFRIFGENVFSLSLLKNLLLYLTYVFAYIGARRFFNNSLIAVMAALSMLLLPQTGWESQRSLTHTVLAVCICGAAFIMFLRILDRQRFADYLMWGFLVGLGLLSKLNVLLFVSALWIACLSIPDIRSKMMNLKAGSGIMLALLIASPYLFWLSTNHAEVVTISHKFGIGITQARLMGLKRLALAVFSFIGPLVAVYLWLFFNKKTKQRHPAREKEISICFHRYFGIGVGILALIILIFGVGNIKDRWLQPLFFLAPAGLLSFLNVTEIDQTTWRKFIRLTGVIVVMIPILLSFRVWGAGLTGRYRTIHYPYVKLTKRLHDLGFQKGLIVAEKTVIAGNMRYQFKESRIVRPPCPNNDIPTNLPVLLIWEPEDGPKIPNSLVSFMEKHVQTGWKKRPPIVIDLPYRFSTDKRVRFHVLLTSPRSALFSGPDGSGINSGNK